MMAGETSQPRRSRPVSATPGDTSAEQTLSESDSSMAPITANTPLPPLTPLPLASQASGESDPPPPPVDWDATAEQPALPPVPAYSSAPPAKSAGGVSSTWAAYTMFALMFTSLILVVVMAIAAAEISKQVAVLIWVIILTFVINLVYAGVVFSIARPGPWQSMRLPFLSPRRRA